MNLLQDIVNAIMGEAAFQVSDLDPNIQFLGCIFLIVFAYLALRSTARFFATLSNKF